MALCTVTVTSFLLYNGYMYCIGLFCLMVHFMYIFFSCHFLPLLVAFFCCCHFQWLNLCLDMVSLVGETWSGQTYRAIDHITVSANCKVRRIFTMKSQPPDTTDDNGLFAVCTFYLPASNYFPSS